MRRASSWNANEDSGLLGLGEFGEEEVVHEFVDKVQTLDVSPKP